MDSFTKKIHFVTRSARLVLWPAIALNTGIIAYCGGATIPQVTLLALALCLIASYGFLINDCKDVQVDRVNRSKRLENASANELRFVWGVAGIALLSSLWLSALLGVKGIITMLAIGLGLTVYTFYARQRLILATILAATLSSTPLWIPSIIFNFSLTIAQTIITVAIVTLLMGREILLDVADMHGDLAGSRKTVATVYGQHPALNLSIGMIGFSGAVTFGLQVCLKLNSPNLAACAVTVGIMWLLLPPILQLKKNPESRPLHATFVSRSRVAMLLLPVLWLSL